MAHWLVKDSTIRLLWRGTLTCLALLVVAGGLVEQHPHFVIDGVFAFPAWYGFVSCIALIVVAKGVGLALKRPDTYYPAEQEQEQEQERG